MQYPLNPHCTEPKLSKDKSRWRILFFYYLDGQKKKVTADYGLNKPPYIIKVNSVIKEVKKIERNQYANMLIARLHDDLLTKYYNPVTKLFESCDKAELPFSKYLEEYLEHNPAKKRRESTKVIYKSYNNRINGYFEGLGKPSISLKDITREIIEDFLYIVESNGTTTTRDNYLVYLKGVFTYCVADLDILLKNPLQRLHVINSNTSKTNRAYPEALLNTVLTHIKGYDVHFYLFLRLIYYTLRRPDELLKARYKDFDFNKGTITFDGNNIKTGKTVYSILPKHLTNELKNWIPDHVNSNDFLFGHVSQMAGSNKYSKKLFASNKTPLTHFQDRFKVIQKKLSLEPGYTIYSFKHTGIVYMIEVMKWTDEEIIAYTGHTDTKILGRYTRDAKRPKKVHTGTI